MSSSIFDLFSIGIGPSSSHTVGPMRAAHRFISQLYQGPPHKLKHITRLKVELFGSLALTGEGHGTLAAIINGLMGEQPETVAPEQVLPHWQQVQRQQQLTLLGQHPIHFCPQQDLLQHKDKRLPGHSNGMRFSAYQQTTCLLEKVYYSIGGGFIIDDDDTAQKPRFQHTTLSLCHRSRIITALP